MTGSARTDSAQGSPRVVMVVGASSGIGRATAHALADRGDHLVLASRSSDVLEEVRRECVARGAGDVLVLPTDVRDAAAVDALFAAAAGRNGRVDGVVLTAGVLAYGRFEDVPKEVFDATFTTNVLGAGNVARAALRRFEEQGVDVTLVSPGGVNTPIYKLAGSYTGRVGHPPPPVDPPEKVAAAIVRALDRPRRDVSVGVANPLLVLGFRALPGVFDVLVTPLMRLFGQSRDPIGHHAGNVFAPVPEKQAVHGDWPRRLFN